jgi:hypothetical protein
MSKSAAILCCLGLVLATAAGCRAYQLGNAGLYRPDIRTVHVDIFTSESYRKFLGQRLTEAVVKQIELDTPYQIASPQNADSFVRGRLLRERKRVLSETINDDPRDIELDYLIEVTWNDRAGMPLMTRQVLKIDRSVDFVPEGGQSRTTAEQEIINRLARQVVQQMQVGW